MKNFLLICFIFLCYPALGQGNMVTISSTVPSQMTICGASKTFTINIYNPSVFLLKNDTLKINMPPGINYQPGSIIGGTESNITVPDSPVFLLSDIPTLTSRNITFIASVGCNIMNYTASGGIVENKIRLNYTANNNPNYDVYTTSSYIIKQPNLSITTITNQSYTGNIGDVFTRCITVTNGGLGELKQFTLTDVHGSGIQINSVNKGSWTNSGLTETILLNGSDFISIGDGDSLLENGESISICETITVLNCISVGSAFEAYWGCGGQNCQSSISSANVVFPNLIPNLVVTPIASMNSCFGQASQQQLKIVNTGLGKAINVQLDIFQSTTTGYYASMGSNIDPASFTIQQGFSGSPSSLTPDSTRATATLACMVSPKGRVFVTIPFVNAGDTIYIKWNTYSCCYNNCTNVGQDHINGWRFKGSYSSICQGAYIIPEIWGRVYARIYGDLTSNGSPSTLSEGQTGTFNFLFSTYANSFPVGPGAHWKFVFTLPACLTYSGNLYILRSNGIDTCNPSSVNVSGNTVTAIFNGNPPWNLTQAELKIDLAVDCSSCGGGEGSLGVKSFYIPDNSCACEIGVSCQNTAISVLCPSPCPEGLAFRYFEMKRTSYGLPDNEPGGGNGLPDVIGDLDFTKIKTDRAMFGDTITDSFNGTVKTSLTYPSWQYAYAYSSKTNGIYLTFVDALLTIYRGGVPVATCTTLTPTITNGGTTRNFKYDLSVTALGACVPVGFLYLNNDSLVFRPRYKVTVNTPGTAILNCSSINEYYMSNIANPSTAADKFQCSNYNGNCSIIGYYHHTHGPDNFAGKSCDNISIRQSYYLSIGPCCNNYAGGNLFPYEYRNWSHISILTAIIPPGYTFVSARFNQIRTAGTIVTNTSPWTPLTPINSTSDTLIFPVEQYFQGYGGTIPLSDDGYQGTLEVTIQPSCKVTPILSQQIKYDWTFAPSNYLTGAGSYPISLTTVQDNIIYTPPTLFLQSTLPTVLAPNNTTSWDISISNTSNTSDALNTWLSGPVISGVTIIKIVDLDNNIVITPTGDIYPVGTVNANTVRHFRLTATFTSCLQDSIIVYSGWNCNAGYPTSVDTYPCIPQKITLKLTPLMPALIVNVTGPSGTIQLCDTATYTIEGVNIQLGTAYKLFLTTTLPLGVTIVPGSSLLSYPVVNPYITIPDPVFVGGTIWKWDLSSISNLLDTSGLKGIVEPTLNTLKLTFKVTTSCTYTSGSIIGFNLKGESACGLPTGKDVSLSSQLGITGATASYNTAIDLITTYISPCADNSTMKVVVNNKGPLAFSTTDSVSLELPPGVSFVSGTFNGIYKAPANGIPLQFILNGKNYLVWKLPQGVAAGDSTVFSFDYKGDPEKLSCDISVFQANTTSSKNVTCTVSGIDCGVNIMTGDTSLAVFTYKAYLSLSNGKGVSVPNPPGGETVTLGFDITNTGQTILSGANSIVKFYYDVNGNGIYDAGDFFLTQDTLLVTNNSTVSYTHSFNVPAGKACSIIAIVDTAVNPCVCNPSQIRINLNFKSAGRDTSVCSGSIITLSYPPVAGYTYSWTPATGLSNANISNPVLTASNLTNAIDSTDYILTTNRMGCIAKDTVRVKVFPLPVLSTSQVNMICGNSGTATVTAMGGSGSYTYLWTTVPVQTTATANNLMQGTYTCTVTDTKGCESTTAVTITTPSSLIAGISSSGNVLCNGGNSGSATATVTGGTGTYNYLWSTTPPQTTANAINLTAGTYTLIVTDSANCSINTSVTITEPTVLTAGNSSVTNILCNGGNNGSATITSTGGTGTHTYSWSTTPVQTSATANNLTAGTYTCTITDINSCTVTVTVTITEPPLLTLAVSGIDVACNSVCNGQTIVIPSGGTSPYTYNWNSGCTAAACNNVCAGTYTITVTDAKGCIVIGDTTVTEPPLLVATLPASTPASCFGVCDGTASVSATGGTGVYQYMWNSVPVQSTANATNLCAGDYTCTVTDVNNCAKTAAVTITEPPVLTLASVTPVTICIGSSAVLSTTASGGNGTYSYTWLPAGTGTTASVTVSPVITTTYTVSVTDANSCTAPVEVVVVTVQPSLTVMASNDTAFCLGGAVLLSASAGGGDGGPYTYVWSPAGTGNGSVVTVTPAVSTTYTVMVADGCGSPPVTDTVRVTVWPLPVIAFNASDTTGCAPLCVNFSDASTISSGNINSWNWNFGSGSAVTQNPSYCFNTPGKYSVTLSTISNNGCTSIFTRINMITVFSLPIAEFEPSPNPTTLFDPNVMFTNLSSPDVNYWFWSFGDGDTLAPFTANPLHKFPTAEKTYITTLIVRNVNGCYDSVQHEIIIGPDFSFYIPNAFSPNGDGVNDLFFGKGIGIIQFEISIFDRWGNFIFHGENLSEAWDGKANYGNEVAQQDVYVWKVNLTDIFHKSHNYIGTVTLVK